VNYLLDTNVLSDLLRGQEPVKSRFTRVRGHVRFILSPVVDFEIRRYLLLKGEKKNQAQYDALVGAWFEPAFDAAHWQHAAELWAARHRIGKPIADADLLIAVTALHQNATLVTNNTDHFLDLGLSLEDWRKP
jgi:predicted nucleic acid-binding protein